MGKRRCKLVFIVTYLHVLNQVFITVMHDSGHVLIPIPAFLSSLIPVPIPAKYPLFHSHSDSSQHSLIPIPTTIPTILKSDISKV